MYLEECHDDGCQEEESQDTDGDITVLDVISCRCRDTTIELVDQPADETAPEESDSDVARIVDTQIQTGVAVDERPSHKEESEHALSYQQGEEHCDAEGVSGMCGEETVFPSPIVIDHIDHRADLRIMGGSPASHEWFDDTIINTTCQEVAQSCGSKDQKHLTGILI